MAIPDVIDLILATAATGRALPAICALGATVTYGEFDSRLRRYAGTFVRREASSILIALPPGAEAYAAMIGAGMAGAFYAPLNITVPLDKLRRIVGLMQPDIIVAEPDLATSVASAAPNAVIVHPGADLAAPLLGRGSRHTEAYVIFTSGTTGDPKGVMIPRIALDHFIDWVTYSKTILPQDRVAQFSNIAFDVSVTDIYGALSLGACLFPVLGRSDRMFPARMVARERLTVWNSVPSVLSLMMQANELTGKLLGTLRIINTCGEPLLPAHVEAVFAAIPHTIMQNSYGPTETTVTMTELRLTADNFADACGASMAIGDPIAGITINLLGGPNADEGEIVITGPQVATGYWGDPDKTAASFRPIDMNGKTTRAYFSGDWAVRRNGHVFFKQRIDRQIKLNGFRLELDEVERAIHDFGYPTACVVKRRDQLVAVLEQRDDREFSEQAFRTSLAAKLESHAIPATVRFVQHMPRTHNDKLDRQAVADWLDHEDRPIDLPAGHA